MDLTTTTSIAEIIASLGVVVLMRTTGGRLWWAAWKTITPDTVVSYVDSTIDDPNLKTKALDEELPWLFALDASTAPDDARANRETRP